LDRPLSPPSALQKLYADRVGVYGARAAGLARRSSLVSNLRGLSFGAFVVSLGFVLFSSERVTAGVVTLLALVTFVVLVVLHARVIDAENEARRFMLVNEDALARVTGAWRKLPHTGAALTEASRPFADDLDLFGKSSLFQRICTAHTRFGQGRLAELLTVAPEPDEVRARQRAVRALAPELEIRQELEALALGLSDRLATGKRAASLTGGTPSTPTTPDPEPLLAWAESEPEIRPRRALVAVARVLPVVTVAGIVAHGAFGLPLLAWTIPLFLQVALIWATRRSTLRVFGAVSTTEGTFLRYGTMLELLERLDLDADLVQALRGGLTSLGSKPSRAMREFRNRVSWLDLRHNGLIHPFANLFLLWDFHCVVALEGWQVAYGKVVRGWFRALGELEALCSLAALAHDEPEFTFPEVSGGPARFVASELGHPLIEAPQRVANDVVLPEPGTALLVTGSNMSGKSTLLRAMGLAAVLAFAGAPVCARRLEISVSMLRTSIRVRDSLESGVSHFYAELAKLKAVMAATDQGQAVLFLLDEVLHGTNSRERQIGARWLLAELLSRGAIGVVSTHDMGLCHLPDPELMARVRLVHFRENIDAGKMTFDYRLREGPVTAGNALRLMRLVGLDVPLE
jgi:hypothetical protein